MLQTINSSLEKLIFQREQMGPVNLGQNWKKMNSPKLLMI